MTEEQEDKAHEVYQALWKSVQDHATAGIKRAELNPEQEDYVRTLLTENVRFWK